VFEARQPFALLKTLDTGPITNHVNIAHNAHGTFAYVTIGGLNDVKVFRTSDFSQFIRPDRASSARMPRAPKTDASDDNRPHNSARLPSADSLHELGSIELSHR
jgi:hypothetical protein